MNSYTVTWTIDVEAETYEDAALEALRIHRNPDSIATVFLVTDKDGQSELIDLDEKGLAR